MRIGRLDFEWTDCPVGAYHWTGYKSSCGCRFFRFGRLEITYFDKGCRCVHCDNYICNCDEDKV